MKTKETTIKILFLAIVCALISATMFSMKAPRAVSYAETGICPHEYDDDCDDECNLCGEKRMPKHYFGEWTVVKEATNDEEGLKERTCVRCHVKQQVVLQKTAVPEPQKEKILSKSDIAGIVVGSVAAGGTRRIYRGDADKKETQKIRRAKVRFYF